MSGDLFRARVGWFRVRMHEDWNAQIARDGFGLADVGRQEGRNGRLEGEGLAVT